MFIHNNLSFSIYFGDKKDCCVKSFNEISVESFEKIRKVLGIDQLIFLNQTHSIDGVCINSFHEKKDQLILFKNSGDYIITNQRRIGVGVVTADCMPVLFYDPVKHISAIVHVGWRGSVNGIIYKVLNQMQEEFNCKKRDVVSYLGPCAKVCCYTIQADFLSYLEDSNFFDQIVFKKGEVLFFDLVRFVKLQLIDSGISADKIKEEYNICTICDENFFSYRRQGLLAGRQPTIIVLR
ncbi:hypothetical protein GF322_02165 [Candidatus Dependentiae bacterium]|nr:hypothetical protein [Candidatus Dependentiae bacterium]